jgi:hypothetical protein
VQGLFSLELPNRTGSQCAAYYRQSHWFRPGEEDSDAPLAAARACLAHHTAALAALWASPLAQQVVQRVEQCLGLGELPAARRSATPASAAPKSANGARAAGEPAAAPRAAPSPLSGAENATQGQVSAAPPSGSTQRSASGSRLGWSSLSLSGRRALAAAAAAAAPPAPAPVVQPASKPATQRLDAAQPPAQHQQPEQKQQQKGKQKQRAAKAAPRGSTPCGAGGGDSSDEEFVAGTLRAPRPSKCAAFLASRGDDDAEAGGAGPKRRKPAAGAAAAGDGAGAASEAAIVRLQLTKDAPGWCRPVAPYVPPEARAAAAAAPDRRVLRAPDLLSFDFASLGGGFLGVIVNASFVDPGDAPATAAGGRGITPAQPAALPIPSCLAGDAIVCVWARKRRTAQVARAMAAAWGCKIVESLAWIELTPEGSVAAAAGGGAGGATAAGHLTLVMGRRGGGGLDLRHQRTADVVVAPALGGGRFPGMVRAMLETLLAGAGGGVRGQGPPRLLEVAFQGGEPGGRAGWVTLVQDSNA